MAEILPPLWNIKGQDAEKLRSMADDAVEDLLERLVREDPAVDIGDVPQLLRDTAHKVETFLAMMGTPRGKA